MNVIEPKPARDLFEIDDVYAFGLTNGRCPVGRVERIVDGFIVLRLFDWLSGGFGTVAAFPLSTIELAQKADDEGRDDDGVQVWQMDRCGAFQTSWTATDLKNRGDHRTDLENWSDHRTIIADLLGCKHNFNAITERVRELLHGSAQS